MVEQSQALAQPWLEPSALIDLLDELRAEGYNIGVGQYIAVNDLLLALAARGESLDDPQRLKSLIGPLLCSSPSEQVDFQQRFDGWLTRLSLATSVAPATTLGAELETIERGSRWRRLIIITGVVAAVISILALILSSAFRFSFFLSQVFAHISRQLELIALLALLAAFAGWRLWLSYRANQFLTRRAINRQPEIARISLAGLEQEVLPPLVMFRVAQNFRRRIEIPSEEIDMDSTIAHTLDHGGWFTPVYRRRMVPPEYLVLIDRATLRDHQARLATELIAALTERDVIITAYYFDGDPRVCIPARPHAAPQTLRELAAVYSQHRLVIFSDARNLFSPVTGLLEPWTETFAQWSDRALLTPEPAAHWGYYEREVAEQFIVLPSTNEGLVELIRHFQQREALVDIADSAVLRLPEELRLRPRRWLGRAAPAAAVVEDVLNQLRAYLGPSGFDWLSACAVYPALQWNLTLYLGNALNDLTGAPLIRTMSLLELARLPWFRHGMMPDWLRARLIDDMSQEQEHTVRIALAALLATAAEGGAADAALEVAHRPGSAMAQLARPLLRHLTRDVTESSPLRDHVFLNFLAGRRQRLAVHAPATFRNLFFGQSRGSAGWLLWLRRVQMNAMAKRARATLLPTRLMRSPTDAIIAGVCGGLAEYFAIDPVIVRLIFVLVTLTSGLGLVIYPILWLVMPKAGTAGSSAEFFPHYAEEWRRRAQQLGVGTYRYDPTTGQPLNPPELATGKMVNLRIDPPELYLAVPPSQYQQPSYAPASPRKRGHVIGFVLLGVGVLVLANLFNIDQYIFPVVMIGAGLLLLRNTRR